jgi:hypothetical protein
MVLNMYDTLVDAINDLQDRGYTSRFKLENNQLINVETKQAYDPQQLQIVEYHRFEGMTNPADDAIVFAIEARAGADQGTVVMNYSSDGNMDLYSFMDKVNIKPRE